MQVYLSHLRSFNRHRISMTSAIQPPHGHNTRSSPYVTWLIDGIGQPWLEALERLPKVWERESDGRGRQQTKTRCASQFPLFPTFLSCVPQLVVIWSYPEQGYDSTTGYFVWLVRSPKTVYHWTLVRHLHYKRSKTCSRHIFCHVPTLLTNDSRVRASKIVRRPCSDSSHVTAPYKSSFTLH